MSDSLSRILTRHVQGVLLGPPRFVRSGTLPNLVIYPLFPRELAGDPPQLITLAEGMKRGVRLSDTGFVNRVRVDNRLSVPLLAGESDLLLGPTQRRAVQFSCIIPPHRSTALPVNCVEEGQPAHARAEFTRAEGCPWRYRAAKLGLLAARGDAQQAALWDEIRDLLRQTDTISQTRDLHAVVERWAPVAEGLIADFPLLDGQVGLVCAVGPVLTMELFSDPEIFEDRYRQVLRSTLVEALSCDTDVVVTEEQASSFLEQIVVASGASRLLPQRGLDPRSRVAVFSQGPLTGGALLADDRLVHLYAHHKRVGFTAPLSAVSADLERSSRRWMAEHRADLERLKAGYARRKHDYAAFKAGLHMPDEEEPAPSPDGLPEGGVAGSVSDVRTPPPLSRSLHEFFLRFFGRP